MENSGIDMYNIPVEQVFQQLGCTREGLTSEAAKHRLRLFGHNVYQFQGNRGFLELMCEFVDTNPFAASIVFAKHFYKLARQDKYLKALWFPFAIYVPVLATILHSAATKARVDSTIRALMAHLAREVKVLRNGRWTMEKTSNLVPGDVIMIEAWDVVPADIRLIEGDPLQIDQSALTGESVEVVKQEGDAVYYGCSCEQGASKAVIVATGACILFGKSMCSHSNRHKYLDKVLTTIMNVSIFLTAAAILVEIVIMFELLFHSGIDSLLALLIGGIPITLRWTTLNLISEGSNIGGLYGNKGAILKRMHVVKEMAEMDVLCIDTSGTLILNKLTVLRDMIEVLAEGLDASIVILMAARACQTENHGAVDAAILGTLDDPKEVWSGIREVLQSRNQTDKLTTITYTDNEGNAHQVCKGDPREILNLINNKNDIVQRIADYFRDRGWQSVAVAHQEVTSEELKDNTKNQWTVIGLIPLYNTPRCNCADIVRRASSIGINVKIITADRLQIAKETGRSLDMNTNMYPAFSLLRQLRDDKSVYASPMKNLIENADGFSDVLPEHKCEIIKQLQSWGHICGITGHSSIDACAMRKADVGIAVATASDSIRKVSDIVLTDPCLDVIICTVLTCRKISHRIKAYIICTVAITAYTLLSFLLFALIWKFNVPPMLLVIFVVLNDALNRATYASYEVIPSSTPDRWNLAEVLRTGIVLGVYSASMTVLFFLAANSTDIFKMVFGVASLKHNYRKLASAMYLQISISSQFLALFTQSRDWSDVRQDKLYVLGLVTSQMIAVYANDDHYWPGISGIGWGWAGVIWSCNIIFYIVLVITKQFIQRV